MTDMNDRTYSLKEVADLICGNDMKDPQRRVPCRGCARSATRPSSHQVAKPVRFDLGGMAAVEDFSSDSRDRAHAVGASQ